MGVPRFDAETARALASASERARALHHHEVDAEHVLLELLDVVKVPILAGIGFVSIPELRRRLEAALAARSTRSLYRDGDAALPMSDRLRTALGRAGDLRGLAIFRAVNTTHLLNSLLADEAVASMALAATLDATPAGVLLDRAVTLAREREQDVVRVEHLLLAATETEWFASASTAGGVDPHDFARHVEKALDDVGPGKRRAAPIHSATVVNLIRTAAFSASGAGMEHVTPQLVVAKATRIRPDLFRTAGVSRAALLRSLAGGPQQAPPAVDPRAEVDVVFHNDDFTTMEFVLAALKDPFGLSSPDATEVMLRVHRSGEAVVTRLPAGDAQARVDRVLLRAEEEGMPLRISLVAASAR